jgi:hypothetical protein
MIPPLPPASSYQAFYFNRSAMEAPGTTFPNYAEEVVDDGEQTFDYEELTDEDEEEISKEEHAHPQSHFPSSSHAEQSNSMAFGPFSSFLQQQNQKHIAFGFTHGQSSRILPHPTAKHLVNTSTQDFTTSLPSEIQSLQSHSAIPPTGVSLSTLSDAIEDYSLLNSRLLPPDSFHPSTMPSNFTTFDDSNAGLWWGGFDHSNAGILPHSNSMLGDEVKIQKEATENQQQQGDQSVK